MTESRSQASICKFSRSLILVLKNSVTICFTQPTHAIVSDLFNPTMAIATLLSGNICPQLYAQALVLELPASQLHLYRTGVSRGNAQNFGD